MPRAHEAPHHAGAHPPQTEHAELHVKSSRVIVQANAMMHAPIGLSNTFDPDLDESPDRLKLTNVIRRRVQHGVVKPQILEMLQSIPRLGWTAVQVELRGRSNRP